ncbi:hypothetical protein WR25_26026 [Diploscapter pachys]|uniref:Secreted protein n=1 Tax=Diploscapter pachys TaxID=2018661 RepID=A0A2A2K4V3_9BILA|nr:hypothetical protein WR25_26026 [Diploscapter pachys]
MPSGLVLPLVLGMWTRLTGCGRYVPAESCAITASIRLSSRSVTASRSMPGVSAPRFCWMRPKASTHKERDSSSRNTPFTRLPVKAIVPSDSSLFKAAQGCISRPPPWFDAGSKLPHFPRSVALSLGSPRTYTADRPSPRQGLSRQLRRVFG